MSVDRPSHEEAQPLLLMAVLILLAAGCSAARPSRDIASVQPSNANALAELPTDARSPEYRLGTVTYSYKVWDRDGELIVRVTRLGSDIEIQKLGFGDDTVRLIALWDSARVDFRQLTVMSLQARARSVLTITVRRDSLWLFAHLADTLATPPKPEQEIHLTHSGAARAQPFIWPWAALIGMQGVLGERRSVPLITEPHGFIVPGVLDVIALETIVVDGTPVPSYKVRVSDGDETAYFWVSTDEPRWIVAHERPALRVELRASSLPVEHCQGSACALLQQAAEIP